MLGPKEKDTKKGWCTKRSKYPHREGPGQVFPPNVTRVAHGQLAEPFIVRVDQVVGMCPFARATTDDPVAKKKGLQLKANKGGERILS
jgi:hypothetical protein